MILQISSKATINIVLILTVQMRYHSEKRIFMMTNYRHISSSVKVRQTWLTKYPGINSSPAKTNMANVKIFQYS